MYQSQAFHGGKNGNKTQKKASKTSMKAPKNTNKGKAVSVAEKKKKKKRNEKYNPNQLLTLHYALRLYFYLAWREKYNLSFHHHL